MTAAGFETAPWGRPAGSKTVEGDMGRIGTHLLAAVGLAAVVGVSPAGQQPTSATSIAPRQGRRQGRIISGC